MAVEFELPVLHISMAAVDKMQGSDALQALWTVFTKTTGALEDGPRLENLTWRLWHRQLLIDRRVTHDEQPVTEKDPSKVEVVEVEVVSEDSDSNDDWEDDSAPPSRDPVFVSRAPVEPISSRRQSSTATLQQPVFGAGRPHRHAGDPPLLSASQPTSSVRPTLTSESRTNSAPEGPYAQRSNSHGTNIGRIISHLLPEKLDVIPPSWALAQPSTPIASSDDHVPSTPEAQPVQFLIHSPSTPPRASDDTLAAHTAPTLMVITPTPRPTPPDTPATRTRAVPTNIPAALSPGATPPALAPPSILSQPHLVLLSHPASDNIISADALPLTPTTAGPPDLTDDDSKKKIFYVQSPEGATASDDGRSHSSSSNSNTTSNVTDPHAAHGSQQPGSLSSATTNEPVIAQPLPEDASPVAPDVSVPRGANHARNSSGNAAYSRAKTARGAKVGKPPARLPLRGRPNLVRTVSNSSDKSPSGVRPKHPARQRSVSEEVYEDVEEPETTNKQTSASTSHTVTSVPVVPAPLSMTPAKSNTPVLTRSVSNPQTTRSPTVKSPPNILAPAALAAPFTTMLPLAPASVQSATTQNTSTEAARPPVNPPANNPPANNNNSSALLGLGRRAVHVETSSDLDLESDSEDVWSDDESDSEDPLARAANEASRQRSMFEKIKPRPPPRSGRTGLLTNLMNPDPSRYPQATYRQHNSAQNLAAGRRGTPNILQTSRSTVAVPTATAVTAEQITTHVSVDPKGRTVGGSGTTRGLRLQARPEGEVDDDGSTDEENSISNELSKSVAQRRLEILANRARAKAPPPAPAMQQTRHGEPDPRSPALAPRPAPQPPPATVPYDMDVRPIHSPRTVRRKMIAGELSESLRRNLMWERTSTRFAMGGGALGSGLRPLTAARPGVTTTNSDRGPPGTRSGDEDASQELGEAGRLTLARNRSWANDFHHAGW